MRRRGVWNEISKKGELVMADTELVNVVARVLVKENGDGGIVR